MSNSVNFSVSGEHITKLVRNLVREGNWRHGLATLIDGFEGMSYDLALAILKGEKRLIGRDSNLEDAEEDPKVRDMLQASYASALMANVLQWDGKYYKAYALVTELGMPDYYKAKEHHDVYGPRAYLFPLESPPSLELAFGAERALFYADNGQADIALPIMSPGFGKAWLLLRPDTEVSDLPLWMSHNTDVAQLAQDGNYDLPVRKHEEPKSSPIVVAEVLSPERQEALRLNSLPFDERVEEIRARIVKFADEDTEVGWHEFKYHDKESSKYLTLKAPKRALMAYAMSRTMGAHLAPHYSPISDPGMKMMVDSRLHTDVWLGCGFMLDDTVYDHDCLEHRAFMDMTFAMQKEMLGYDFQVLTSGGKSMVYGTLVGPDDEIAEGEDILLVPHAGVEFDLPARQAAAIICETGGRLAHLVTVCREDNKPIIRVPDAMKILRPGMRVMLNLETGKLDIAAV